MNVVANRAYPKREDYDPVIRSFMPGVDREELELRASLLLMRDRAMATKPIACEEAWVILDLVERTASRDAFRSMAVNELAEIKRLLIRLVSTASGFDGVFGSQLDGVKANGHG